MIIDDPENGECMGIDAAEFYETANSRNATDTGSSNNFKVHNNSMNESFDFVKFNR
jgi:hypothetical protein